MRIFIATIDDPLVLNDFVKKIIKAKKDDIVGISISTHTQFKTKRGKIDLNYMLALFLIAGFKESFIRFLKYLSYKIKKLIKKINKNY